MLRVRTNEETQKARNASKKERTDFAFSGKTRTEDKRRIRATNES